MNVPRIYYSRGWLRYSITRLTQSIDLYVCLNNSLHHIRPWTVRRKQTGDCIDSVRPTIHPVHVVWVILFRTTKMTPSIWYFTSTGWQKFHIRTPDLPVLHMRSGDDHVTVTTTAPVRKSLTSLGININMNVFTNKCQWCDAWDVVLHKGHIHQLHVVYVSLWIGAWESVYKNSDIHELLGTWEVSHGHTIHKCANNSRLLSVEILNYLYCPANRRRLFFNSIHHDCINATVGHLVSWIKIIKDSHENCVMLVNSSTISSPLVRL